MSLAARVCPHCLASATLDLRLKSSIDDPRERYRVSRALAALGPPYPAFLDAQRLLERPGSFLLRGLTRAEALEHEALLAATGIDCEAFEHEAAAARPQDQPLGARLGRFRPAAIAAALLFPVVLLAAILTTGGKERTAAVPSAPPPRKLPGAGATPDPRAFLEKARASTVSLRCESGYGAGFVVAEGLVLTNAHVTCGDDSPVEVRFLGGRTERAATLKRDEWLDLALLKVEGPTPAPLVLGDSTRLAAGATIWAVGSPVALESTVTRGIVSHAARPVLGTAYLQVDASINPGNSGGPLIDEQGLVVGVVSMKIRGTDGIGLALPVNYLFGPDTAWLPPPPGVSPAEPRWLKLLGEIAEEDRKQAASAEEMFRKPGLLAAAMSGGTSIRAVVIRLGTFPPSAETLRFSLRRGPQEVCSGTASVNSWYQASRNGGAGAAGREVEWLRRHGLGGDVFLATVSVLTPHCQELRVPQGLVLVLDDGAPGADRSSLTTAF